jgi:hypothetical protein
MELWKRGGIVKGHNHQAGAASNVLFARCRRTQLVVLRELQPPFLLCSLSGLTEEARTHAFVDGKLRPAHNVIRDTRRIFAN